MQLFFSFITRIVKLSICVLILPLCFVFTRVAYLLARSVVKWPLNSLNQPPASITSQTLKVTSLRRFLHSEYDFPILKHRRSFVIPLDRFSWKPFKTKLFVFGCCFVIAHRHQPSSHPQSAYQTPSLKRRHRKPTHTKRQHNCKRHVNHAIIFAHRKSASLCTCCVDNNNPGCLINFVCRIACCHNPLHSIPRKSTPVFPTHTHTHNVLFARYFTLSRKSQ